MIAEGLKALVSLAVDAVTPRKLDQPDPRKVVYALGRGVEVIDLPPPPRDHKAGTLDEVVALANRFAEADSRPTVWYEEGAVALVIDDQAHRVERATFALERSDVFARLVALRLYPEWHETKPFARLLRIDLAGTLEPGVLLERVRHLTFEGGSVVTARVGPRDESMGRSISSKVSGEGDIPLEVVLSVPVYKNPGETRRYPVRCAVEVDSAMCRLQLLPLPDELERVAALALASIGERLREGLDGGVNCYQVRP